MFKTIKAMANTLITMADHATNITNALGETSEHMVNNRTKVWIAESNLVLREDMCKLSEREAQVEIQEEKIKLKLAEAKAKLKAVA